MSRRRRTTLRRRMTPRRRKTLRRLGILGSVGIVMLVTLVALAGCGTGDANGDGNGNGDGTTAGEPPDQAMGSPHSPLSIEEAQTLETGVTAWLQGSLYSSSEEFLLCGAMAESFPPQCGGPSLALEGIEVSDIPGLTRTGPEFDGEPVVWSDFPAVLRGTVGDGTFTASPPPTWEAGSEGLRLRVAHMPGQLVSGANMSWLFDVANDTDSEIELTYPTGQQGDVVLSDDEGEVYRWSEARGFTQAIETVTIPAGDRISFFLSDTLTLEPGTYQLEATVASAEPDLPPVTADITIEPR